MKMYIPDKYRNKYEFSHIDERFLFGKYKGKTVSDVLDCNPSYIEWCQKEIDDFVLYDSIIDEIRVAYPGFVMDYMFEEIRLHNQIDILDDSYDEENYSETRTYNQYAGSWAQEVEGYSDDDIDTIFDGEPDAYWNID